MEDHGTAAQGWDAGEEQAWVARISSLISHYDVSSTSADRGLCLQLHSSHHQREFLFVPRCPSGQVLENRCPDGQSRILS